MRTAAQKKGKIIILLLLAFIFCFGIERNVYASDGDYAICDAEFVDRTETETPSILGTWIGAEDKTNYSVRLYKGEKLLSSRVVKATTIDFSSVLILKVAGAGNYRFTVTTTKGNVRIESDTMEITSKMVGLIRTRIAKERKEARAKAGGGWEKGPGDIWIYYDKNGDQVKNRWLEVNGHRYYLDESGIMQTGWNIIGQRYYYLEPTGSDVHPLGSLWRSATTPDGHQVDMNGARIGDLATAPAVKLKALTAVSFYLKEKVTVGGYSELLDITCSNGTVSNISYSSDPKTWTNTAAGTAVFDVKLTQGLKTTQNLKLNCSRAAGMRILSKTSDTMRIELQYIAKYQLKAPENFMITTDGKISWEKVTNADGYKVVVNVQEDQDGALTAKTNTHSVSSPGFTLSDYGYYEEDLISQITVQAVGANKKTVANSAVSRLNSIAELRAAHTVNGKFSRTGSGLRYTDENGETVRGWQEIGGYRYFFRNTGYAAGPGWYQNEDKNWYYFDEYNRMVTGQIVDNGKTYTLNDGSNKKLPLGAMIE